MLPSDLAKVGTEDAHQAALFCYMNSARLHGFAIADRWAEIGVPGLSGTAYKGPGTEALPYLKWLHAIPNGGSRGDTKKAAMIRGSKLKATGVKKGVFDIHLPYPVFAGYDHNAQPVNFPGLYIEMKVPSRKPKDPKAKGGMSDEQIEFGEYLDLMGYARATCYGWEEAVVVVKEYLGFPPS